MKGSPRPRRRAPQVHRHLHPHPYVLAEFGPRGSAETGSGVWCAGRAGTCLVGRSPDVRAHAQGCLVSSQELERLEVERVEMIRQHLCQYTQLRHETDMFNQSVSSRMGVPRPVGPAGAGEGGGPGREETVVSWTSAASREGLTARPARRHESVPST